MIDLHCHLLWGLDDGPRELSESIELARVAVAAGTEVIVATPHIRHDHPFEIEALQERADELRAALASEGLALQVRLGGEVSIDKARELDDNELRAVALGSGPYVLVESPYVPVEELLEGTLLDLQLRGFRPVLAHPERSPCFVNDTHRVSALVRSGVLCSVSAGSVTGQFGRRVRRIALDLLRGGLVHNLASDAHDAGRRPPGLEKAVAAIGTELQSQPSLGDWLTRAVPASLLEGKRPPRPDPPSRRRIRLPLSRR
jgi:protein-tyrosine phosphatase